MEYTNYIENGGIELNEMYGGGKPFGRLSCPMGLCMQAPKPSQNIKFRTNEEREPRVINTSFFDTLIDQVVTSIDSNMQTIKTSLNFTKKSRKISKQLSNKSNKSNKTKKYIKPL